MIYRTNMVYDQTSRLNLAHALARARINASVYIRDGLLQVVNPAGTPKEEREKANTAVEEWLKDRRHAYTPLRGRKILSGLR